MHRKLEVDASEPGKALKMSVQTAMFWRKSGLLGWLKAQLTGRWRRRQFGWLGGGDGGSLDGLGSSGKRLPEVTKNPAVAGFGGGDGGI